MIKAEVVEYPGAEVPNWVAKCKDILTSTPALGTLTLAALAVVGVFFWHGRQPAFTNSTATQSQPVSNSSLQVMPLTNAPLAEPTSAVPSSPSTTTSPNAASGSATTPVGPAPTNSLNSLQPSGTTQPNTPSLPQAAGQSIQSAGKATLDSLTNLGL